MTDPLPVSLQSRITLDAKSGEAIVSDINLLISPMVVTGSIDISNLNDNLTYFGKLQSNNFDIIALMRTMGYLKYEAEFSGAIEPTEAFNFDLHFEGDSSELSLERFDGNLGETEIKARADIRFSDEYGPYSSRYELRASRIDFSPFLSLASEKADSDESSSSGILTAQSSPFDLPLDNIKGLNLLGSIAIESITASNFTIEDVNLFTNIEDGVLDVEDEAPLNINVHTLPKPSNASFVIDYLTVTQDIGQLSGTSQNNRPITCSIVDNATIGTINISDSSSCQFNYTGLENITSNTTDSFTFKVNDGYIAVSYTHLTLPTKA